MRYVLGFIAVVVVLGFVLNRLETSAEDRIGRQVPSREIDVSMLRMRVEWKSMEWNGVTAGEATLDVPYLAAFRHFISRKPVRSATVTARNAVFDLTHPALEPVKSVLVLGGYRQPTLNVGETTVQATQSSGILTIVSSEVQSEIGRFQYQGDVVNGRLANGVLTVTGANPSFEGMLVTMTRLSGGRSERSDNRLVLVFP